MSGSDLLINAAAFGAILALVLILVYMGFDHVDFDNDLEPWQKTALSGFVAGAVGYVAWKSGLEDVAGKFTGDSE